MDGSSHPDPPESTGSNSNSHIEHNAPQSQPNDASPTSEIESVIHSGLKRPHETDNRSESGEKRQYVVSDDEEDLDLEALMAHLQQHTEQQNLQHTENVSVSNEKQSPKFSSETEKQLDITKVHDSGVNTNLHSRGSSPLDSESNYDDEEPDEEAATETELSIAAQLRGALSSLQELTTNDSDDIDLDEITQLLQSAQGKPATDELSEEPDSAGQTTSSRSDAADGQSETAPSSRELIPLSSTHSGRDPAKHKREELMLRMPPPPAHLKTLPPMPPPPPAFTSPIASYTASEISRNRDRVSSLVPEPPSLRRGSISLNNRISTTQSHLPSISSSQNSANRIAAADKPTTETLTKFPEPRFSEVPTVSDNYGSMLANEVDGVLSESSNSSHATIGSPVAEQPFPASRDTTAPFSHVALNLNSNKAILETRKRSILLLDSLSCQILDTLSFSHYQDTLTTVMQPESDRGMAYRILLDAFEDLKRMYLKWETPSSRNQPEPKLAEARPFLPYNVPGIEATRDNLVTIQRVNLATFVAAVFGSIEIGFHELNDWFIKVFVPENGRLLKQQCNIYLDLKTQAYISALETTDDAEAQQEALEHLFPANLESQMQEMLGDRVSLAPTEKDFVAKCNRRKENIKSEDPKSLPMKYHWVPFLRDISEYVSRNHYTLLPQRRHSIVPTEIEAHPLPANTPSIRQYAGNRRQAPAPSSRANSAAPEANTPTKSLHEDGRQPHASRGDLDQNNTHPETASRGEVESSAINNPTIVEVSTARPSDAPARGRDEDLKLEPMDAHTPENVHSSTQAQASTEPVTRDSQSNATSKGTSVPELAPARTPESSDRSSGPVTKHPSIPLEGHPLFPPLPKQVLPRPPPSGTPTEPVERERTRRPGPRNQPLPDLAVNPDTSNTLAVYEAARASAEGTDLVRPKVSLYTTRRTWTKEEEEALLKGMDRVQGPYWAQILELYGPGGKINEVLKDRTQVQLKDKARNLKMFFVRLGLPIPAVFQYVTGDYETRKSSSKRVRDKKQLKAAGAMGAHPTLPPRYPANSGQTQILSPNMHQPQVGNGMPHNVGHGASPGMQQGHATTVYGNAQHASTNVPIGLPNVSNSLSNTQQILQSLPSHMQGPTATVPVGSLAGNSVSANPGNVHRGQDKGQVTISNIRDTMTTAASKPSTQSLSGDERQKASSSIDLANTPSANTNQEGVSTANGNTTSSLLGSRPFFADKSDLDTSPNPTRDVQAPDHTATGIVSSTPSQSQSPSSFLSAKAPNENVSANILSQNEEPSNGPSLSRSQSNIHTGSEVAEITPKASSSSVTIAHDSQQTPANITDRPVTVTSPGRPDSELEEHEDEEEDDELSNLLDRVGKYVENN